MNVLNVVIVDTLRQAFSLRVIRNECRKFMTRDTSKIGLWRQFNWFYKIYLVNKRKGLITAYLGILDDKPVAYGLIRYENGKPIISEGTAKKYRGKGIGKTLLRFLTKEASKINGQVGRSSVFAETLEISTHAREVFRQLGYVEKRKTNGIVYMQHEFGEFDKL